MTDARGPGDDTLEAMEPDPATPTTAGWAPGPAQPATGSGPATAYGPAPAQPATGSGPATAYGPAPRSLRGSSLVAAFAIVCLFSAAVGAVVGMSLGRRHRSIGTVPVGRLVPLGPGSGRSNADVAAIAAKLRAAVVDVVSTLGFQGGTATGTGMVLTASGEVLTNNHVIAGATQVSVQIGGIGQMYPATVVGTDAIDDVALLQVQGGPALKTVSIGDSSRLSIGQPVVAIGDALGRPGPPTATSAVVTALNQSITAADLAAGTSERLVGLIQTDAALRPGDSGGPLVNRSAEVVGMDTAASGRSFGPAANVAFAVPINKAMAIVGEMRAGRGSAAIHIGPAALLGVKLASAGPGAAVVAVTPHSPAEAAGLQGGDVIVSFDGMVVDSPRTLTGLVAPHHPGDAVEVIWSDRFGQRHRAVIHLAAGPAG